MKKNNQFFKRAIIAFLLLSLFVGTVTAASKMVSKHGITNPPKGQVDAQKWEEQIKDQQGQDFMVQFGENEKKYCLDYLNHFKTEELSGGETPEEAARITKKNAMIQEYRVYVENLYGQTMKKEVYKNHYDHLMGIVFDLLALEPDPTPEEEFAVEMNNMLVGMKDKLYYSGVHGKAYMKDYGINLPLLQQVVKDLENLVQAYGDGELSFTQARQAYANLMEQKVRFACTWAYTNYSEYTERQG